MFDPNNYFRIIRGRAVCPVHGKRDRNLAIHRHKSQPKWVFNCYSRGCSLQEIALAAGFNPADVYDNDRDPDWQPTITATEAGGLDELIAYAKQKQVTDTLEPNPCTRLHFQHEDGTIIDKPCDSKRCHDCGPIKQKLMQHQLETGFGEYTHIEAIQTRAECDRLVERNKKRGKQQGTKHLYQIVGDDQRGYIMISNMDLTRTTLQTLADWMERVLRMYRTADNRARRSWGLGRLSRLTPRRSMASRESPSLWHRVTRQWVVAPAVPDTIQELHDEIEAEQYFKHRDYVAARLREKGQRAHKLAHRGGSW